MLRSALILSALCLTGCTTAGRIKSALATVQAVPDAGKPATLATATAGEVLPLPAGSEVTVTKFEALAAIPASPGVPAVAPQPARLVTEVRLAGPTEWRKTEETVKADTGTVDTSIAAKRIEAAESRVLLYAAMAAVAAAGVFFWLQYPSPALMCGGAAVVLFLAWKLTGLPDWFWVVGAVALGCAVFLYLGHERGEKAKPQPPTQ